MFYAGSPIVIKRVDKDGGMQVQFKGTRIKGRLSPTQIKASMSFDRQDSIDRQKKHLLPMARKFGIKKITLASEQQCS